jgi:hypothetical protein
MMAVITTKQKSSFHLTPARVICFGDLQFKIQMEEIWKPINGFEGLYEVSNMGRVKSLAKEWTGGNGAVITHDILILSNLKDGDGYLKVILCQSGIQKPFKIHRLVATHFIENPLNKPAVNHIDGNKQNNCDWNLEWNTNSENTKHAFAIGLKESQRNAVRILGKSLVGATSPTSKKVIDTETGKEYFSLREAAKQNNIHERTLSSYLLNQRKNKTNLKYL